MSTFRHRGVLAVLVSVLLLAGCGGDEPSTASWVQQWETMGAVIPDLAEIGSPPDQTLCRDTLGRLRELSADLAPAPSTTITELVNEWVAVAEASFFGCPPESEDITSFEEAYQELERIEESIETALANAE